MQKNKILLLLFIFILMSCGNDNYETNIRQDFVYINMKHTLESSKINVEESFNVELIIPDNLKSENFPDDSYPIDSTSMIFKISIFEYTSGKIDVYDLESAWNNFTIAPIEGDPTVQPWLIDPFYEYESGTIVRSERTDGMEKILWRIGAFIPGIYVCIVDEIADNKGSFQSGFEFETIIPYVRNQSDANLQLSIDENNYEFFKDSKGLFLFEVQ